MSSALGVRTRQHRREYPPDGARLKSGANKEQNGGSRNTLGMAYGYGQ